jgi:hypothetical protein
MTDLEQLGERIADQAAHLDAAMHRLLTDLRDFDERGGWHAQGARSCAHWLAWRVGWDLVTARDHVRVAAKLAEFPAIDDALRRGEISYSKVRAMLRIATQANEPLLLEHARLMTASQLEKLCRKYAFVQRHDQNPHPLADAERRFVRRRDTDDGMVKIEAVLHPEEAELIWTMLDHAATRLAREPVPSDALDREPPRPAIAAPASAIPPDAADLAHASPSAAAPASSAIACRSPQALESARPAGMPTSPAIRFIHAELPSPDDSAESQRASTVAAPAGAEPAGADPAGADPAGAEPAGGYDGGSLPADDSEESRRASAIADLAGAEPAGGHDGDGLSADDSAESRRPPASRVAQPGAAGASSQLAGHHKIMDAVLRQIYGAGSVDGRAGMPGSDARSDSLLDRLLDDADALQSAARTGSYEAAVAPVPTRSSVEASQRAIGGSESSSAAHCVPAARSPSTESRLCVDTTRRAFNRADALVSLAQAYLRGERPERSPIEVVLTIPASSLAMDAAADPVETGELGEAFVSAETARRLSCDAGLVEVVEDEHGAPLSIGRKRRTITGALKRALRKRDTTCTYPGCANRVFLEGHHIKHWADGGETSLGNAALLCSLHHRFVHEYGYQIELGLDQRPCFRDPRGRLVAEVPARRVMADLGWPGIRAANAPLAVTADTIACGWDGRPANYAAIVGHLLAVDSVANP